MAETLSWLPQTKLRPPLVPAGILARPRLDVALRAAVTMQRLTVITAPAGSGKTTLLAVLAAPIEAAPHLPIAWLSLDEDDDDPARFLTALLTTVGGLWPAGAASAKALLASLEHPAGEIRRVIGVLVNGLLQTAPAPFVVVLDDLHVISSAPIHAALDYLLEHLPPQMHLAVATRHDPPLALARLRARRQLAELGLADQGAFTLLRTWIMALPTTVQQAHPRLAYFLGICAWEHWELDHATTFFRQALEGFTLTEDAGGQGQALVYIAAARATMGDLPGGQHAAEQALARPIPAHNRAQLYCVRAWIELAHGKWELAIAALDSAITLAETTADQRVLRILASQVHSPFGVLPGGLNLLERFCVLLAVQLPRSDSPLQAASAQLSAFVHLWRGDWDAAVQAGERALALSAQFGDLLWVNADVGALLPACYALRGEADAADRGFATLFDNLAQPAATAYADAWMAMYLCLRGRMEWLQGRLDVAHATLARMDTIANPLEWPSGPPLRALLRGLLRLSEGDYPAAEEALREAANGEQTLRFTAFSGSAGILLAYLYLQWGRRDEALATLEPQLVEYAQHQTPGALLYEGTIVIVPLLRLAVEHGVAPVFASQVLAQLGVMHPQEQSVAPAIRVPETGATLTPRELEILRLIASGADNPTIAAQLVISVHTVKSHVAHLLDKLAVASRTEAAIRARELGIR